MKGASDKNTTDIIQKYESEGVLAVYLLKSMEQKEHLDNICSQTVYMAMLMH